MNLDKIPGKNRGMMWILSGKISDSGDIVYLDNAATSFSPEPVIGSMVEFEHCYRANVGRGVHRLTQLAPSGTGTPTRKSQNLSTAREG